jgi:two-component system sensor histidine kinase CpxA
LVRDFNSMADRIELLIAGQRQLLYDMSHEVRSPLARLNVALDLARERKGQDPAFEHMEQDLARLDQTMERLLMIARLDTSAAPVAMSAVDLAELVSQIATDARFEIQDQNRSIEFSAEENCHVIGNAELLHSAIENVIRNAVRYTSSDTTVQVQLRRLREDGVPHAVLSVRDYGPGVPESERTNIFRAFYRTADARDRDTGGAGLGLAIADRVVRLHGGRIWAENADDKGLLVRIHLPLGDAPTLQPGPEGTTNT